MSGNKRSWEESCELLKEFKEKNGHCNVSQQFTDDPALGHWVKKQRTRKKTMSADRLQQLDTIGFDWDPQETKWNEMYERLTAYKKNHGHCTVPVNFDKELKMWVGLQRRLERNGSVRPDRKTKLNLLDFSRRTKRNNSVSENVQYARWHAKYTKLVEFQKIHGHCSVPMRYKEDSTLATFVRDQRQYKQGLTRKQITLLDEIGFQWKVRQRTRAKSLESVPEVENMEASDDGCKMLPDDDDETVTVDDGSADERLLDDDRRNAASESVQLSGGTDSEVETTLLHSSSDKSRAASRLDQDTIDETNVESQSEEKYIPRSVHLRRVDGVKRKYKTKARRYFDQRNALREEVKRLKLELRGVALGNQLVNHE